MGPFRRASALIFLTFAALVPPALAQTSPPPSAPPPSAPAAAPATCTTYNEASEPASSFRAGERITVSGQGFGPRSLVLVSFQQGTRTVELAQVTSNDLGAFRTARVPLPASVTTGAASVRSLDARGSAICAITVKPAAASDDEPTLLYIIWGSALAIFGVVLALLTYRRWKTERLRAAMDDLAWAARDSEPEPVGASSTTSHRTGDAERSYLPDLGWFDEIGPSADPENDENAPDLDDPDDVVVAQSGRPTSDAIARLRREVQAWRRP